MHSNDNVITYKDVAIRPAEGKAVFSYELDRIDVQQASLEDIFETDWAAGNARFVVKDKEGSVILVAPIITDANIAIALLGEESCQVEQGDLAGEASKGRIRDGLTTFNLGSAYESAASAGHTRLTHAVIQNGNFGGYDPFIRALCSEKLAGPLNGVEVGRVARDGSFKWSGEGLVTVPLTYKE